MNIRERFFNQVVHDIQHKRLVLPSLPELALRVRQMVEDTGVSVAAIAKVVSMDAAMSSRLIEVANSAFYRGKTPVEDVRAAIARVGNNTVRNLVTALLLKQMYLVKSSPVVRKHLQALQQHNIEVAAYSQVLAHKFTSLKPDVAMLGGLVHRIGALPLLVYADSIPEIVGDEASLMAVVEQMHRAVGRLILEAWNFPESLVLVVTEYEDLQRKGGAQPDYVDVVQVASLHTYLGTDHPWAEVQWDTVPAFAKLGLTTPKEHMEMMRQASDEVSQVKALLSA